MCRREGHAAEYAETKFRLLTCYESRVTSCELRVTRRAEVGVLPQLDARHRRRDGPLARSAPPRPVPLDAAAAPVARVAALAAAEALGVVGEGGEEGDLGSYTCNL